MAAGFWSCQGFLESIKVGPTLLPSEQTSSQVFAIRDVGGSIASPFAAGPLTPPNPWELLC